MSGIGWRAVNELSRSIPRGAVVLGDGVVYEVTDDYTPGPRHGIPAWNWGTGRQLDGSEQEIPSVGDELYELVRTA